MRARDAIRDDLLLLDRVATCPDCGDYAPDGATVCESCAAHLFPSAPELRPLVCPNCLIELKESPCWLCGASLEINQPVAATPSGSTAATGLGGQ